MIDSIADRSLGTLQQMARMQQRFFGGNTGTDSEHAIGAERGVGGGGVGKVETGGIGDQLFHDVLRRCSGAATLRC
ncbi:hypothetical protein D3C81_2196080 [compost metagenome]